MAVERNVGEQEHAYFQNFVAAWFFVHAADWGVISLTEQRVQIAADRYRIPDVCLREASDPLDRILWRPPVLCVEIMSRGDSLPEMRRRAQDYVQMGVREIWVIDPLRRRAFAWSHDELEEFRGDMLGISGSAIHLPLTRLWAELDRLTK
jgi:Uma2 family endonuclease